MTPIFSRLVTVMPDKKPLNIVGLNQTLYSSPSQWIGVTDCGQFIYIRYRFGRLEFHASRHPWSVMEQGSVIFRRQVGGEWDGEMTSAEMATILITNSVATFDVKRCKVEME